MVTKEMVAGMKAGSITVDLAAEAGGNIETTVKDEKFVTPNGGKYSTHTERNKEQRVCTVLLLMERFHLISSHLHRLHRFAIKAAYDVVFVVFEQYFEVFAERGSTDNETSWLLLH